MPLLRRAQANSTQSSSRLNKREEHRIHIQAYIMFRSHNEKAGSQLCEEEASFYFIIGVRGKACAPQLMLLSIGFPDEKQLIGAYHKSRRDERPQTGAQAPGGSATTKEAPTGRQSLNVLYANQLDVLSPLRGFFSRHVSYRGFTPPSVVFRLFETFSKPP